MLQEKLSGLKELRHFDNWRHLLFNRLLFPKQGLVVYRHHNMEILIDHSGGDQNGTRSCLTSDMYSRYFRLLPGEAPLRVLDLGANGGGFVLALLDHGIKLAEVACVEMNPQTFLRLHFNVSRNFSGPKHLINAAVWNRNSTLELVLNHGGTGESVHQEQAGDKGEKTAVQARTLDSIANDVFPEGVIDLCKLDVEGAEHEILMSDTAAALGRVRHLIIEIHPHRSGTAASLLERLATQGFFVEVPPNETDEDCAVYFLTNKKL